MFNLVDNPLPLTLARQINREYQIYFLFVVFLVSLQLICNTIEPIIVQVGWLNIPTSALFYVLSFAVCDIITEVFGFKLAVRATILNIFAQLIYCGVATMVFLLPNSFLSAHSVASFSNIFHFLSLELLSSVLSLLVAMVCNDYLINRLKLIFLGRGFWWRTIVSTVLGEIVMLNIDYNITFFADLNLIQIQYLIFTAMAYKVFAAFLLAYPATILARYLSQQIVLLKPNLLQKTKLTMELKDALFFQ